MYSSQPYTFDRVVRLIITVIAILMVLFIINLLKGVLLPFGVACVIAYMMEPMVQYNRRLLKLKSRVPAIFVTLFESLFFLAALCYFIVPMIMSELEIMAGMLRTYASKEISIEFLPDAWQDFLRRNIDFNHLSQIITPQELTRWVEKGINASWTILEGSISMILSVFSWCIVILYVVFIMIDYDRLSIGMRRMVPPRYRSRAFAIGNDIKNSMNHYFRGQALVAACVGVLFSIGFLIMGLPLAIVLGLFIGLLNMVPYLQLVSIVPSVALCLVYSVGSGQPFWTIFWQCMAVYGIVQVIQDLVLTPKIMGKAMGLNPAIILLSLSIWGSLLGFIGLIIALPLTTLLLSYYERYIIRRNDSGLPQSEINSDIEAVEKATRFPPE
ncbi:MAG: AI-2E family transporter [Paramuribaculum sp.]|nr:AI-2E family transporter [Paramuribaculum sp.]